MSFYTNKRRQLVGYSDHLDDIFNRLKEHLKENSFIDSSSVEDVTSHIGRLNMLRINAAIARADQSDLIATTLLQALKMERKFLEVESEVCLVL